MLTLDQALRNIPDLDRSREAVPLTGGLSNRSWQIEIGGVPHVLRLRSDDTIAPHDFARELKIHEKAHEAGLAPAIYYADKEDEILVTEKVAGDSLSATDLQRANVIEDVARLLRRVHDLPPTGERLDLISHAEHYARAITTELDNVAADVVSTLTEWRDRLAAPQTSLCHNDPVAENIVRGGPLMLIDWEFAADNDPMFDLAALSAHHEFADSVKRRLLDHYGLGADATEMGRLAGWETVYRCLCWLWLAAQRGDTDRASEDLERLHRLIRQAN